MSPFLEPYLLLLPREFQCRIRIAEGSVPSMSVLVSGRLMNGWALTREVIIGKVFVIYIFYLLD